MPRLLLRARDTVLAVLVCLLVPLPATAAPAGKDLGQLTTELAAVTARAERLTQSLNDAAARDGGLRVAHARLEDAKHTAQWALGRRARQVYMASTPAPVGDWRAGLAAPELQELARRGQRAALAVDRDLIEAVTARAAQVAVLQRRADAFRARLLVQATAVMAEQERARGLLAQAEQVARRQRAVTVLPQLQARRVALDRVSAQVTVALTPAQSRRSRRAQQTEAPVIALLEQAGAGLPTGYVRTGQVVTGQASWYGPGFIGKPTASGAPYDPERATCAHKTLPLGTVLHVTRGGLAVSCLVNDRGPYVGDRVLDLSRAGSRALGFSGVAVVTFEVLAPG